MGLFNLTGINFNKDAPRKGAAGPLVGGNYESNIYRYPEDIGNYDKGHYMVFHINEQEHTKNPGIPSGDLPQVISNKMAYGAKGSSTFASETAKGVNNLEQVGGILDSAVSSGAQNIDKATKTDYASSGYSAGKNLVKDVFGSTYDQLKSGLTSENGLRTIKRTTDTIAMYMPDTLAFTHNQGYSDLTLSGKTTGAITAGASFADAIKGQNDVKQASKQVLTNLAPWMATFGLDALGDFGKFAVTSTFGVVQNPMLELLYHAPQFRTFRFDFVFYPRSENEAEQVQLILERFRYHQAPELRKEMTSFFLIPPSEFDIKFYYNGKENPNIPKISTCVLETIDIDYAPNGFSAYEVPGQTNATLGGTGMPVAIRLGLQFKETEIMTKDHFNGTRKEMRTTSEIEQSKSLKDAW